MDLYFYVKEVKKLDKYTDIIDDIYIQLCFYDINILYFTRFSVRSSISELDAVMLSDYLQTNLLGDP